MCMLLGYVSVCFFSVLFISFFLFCFVVDFVFEGVILLIVFVFILFLLLFLFPLCFECFCYFQVTEKRGKALFRKDPSDFDVP